MKWRCALYQRWLPRHLDGELTGFRQRQLEAHLNGCAACRLEVEGLQEMVHLVHAHPLPEPDPAFWQDFSRELHLKLVHVAPAEPTRRWFQLPPVLVAAPVLAVLLVWLATQISLSPTPTGTVAHNGASEQLVYAGMDDGLWQGEEFPSWDVNAVVADLSEHEREILLKRLRF